MALKQFGSWEHFWKWFDYLVQELETSNQQDTAQKLREAKSLVNGLTDGWYDFLNGFEITLLADADKFNAEQVKLAAALISFLKGVLNSR